MLSDLDPCDLLSIQVVASKLDITERTLYKYIKEDKIAAVRVGRRWKIPVAAYMAFLYDNAYKHLLSAQEVFKDFDRKLAALKGNGGKR